MRIAIIGTGAMGSLFAALLSSVADVIMVGSWSDQLVAVQDQGLRLDRLDGGQSCHVFPATASAHDASPADLALILVKGWQTAGAAVLAREALAPTGLAITLQNGLGNREVLSAEIGTARTVQGVTSEGATLLGPGKVRHAGRGHTYFAADETTRPRLKAVASAFRKAGFETEVVSDAQSLIWGKLVINAAINPLTALLQVPNGRLLSYHQTLDIMELAAQEVAAVAKRLSITLPFDDAPEQAVVVARATAQNRSSMAQDIARRMPTEIEQICGPIVRHGHAASVPTPVNEALMHLVKAQVVHGAWREAISDLPEGIRPLFAALATLEN